MSWRVELALTIAVCAAGGGYFVWRAIAAAGEQQRLMYIAFVIAGAVLAQRAVKDVLQRRRRELEDGEQR